MHKCSNFQPTFVLKCDPPKLYQFFMRATQLQNCLEDYNMAAIDKAEAEALIGDKRKSLPTLKKEYMKWEKKYNLHMSLNNKKDDVKKKKVIGSELFYSFFLTLV